MHDKVNTAEEKEREVANLERYKEEINAEINDVRDKINEVHNEMEKLQDCIDDDYEY